jgi:Uma2 family endonuclease
MGAQAVATLFPQEYLEMEATSTIKHEYYNGVLVAMAGASYEHNLITENLKGNLFSLLKGKPCRTLGSDMRVKLNEEGSYIYPDITVFFGAPNLTLETPSSLLNPTLIVEVLSTSTEE